MDDLLARLLADVKLVPEGASAERIEAVEAALGAKLPPELAALLAEHDGGEGTMGDRKRPFVLWGLDRIAREAEEQEVTRATPGLVLFGSDGGAEGYGHLPRLQRGRYGRISFLAAGAHEFESLGDTLAQLLQAIATDR